VCVGCSFEHASQDRLEGKGQDYEANEEAQRISATVRGAPRHKRGAKWGLEQARLSLSERQVTTFVTTTRLQFATAAIQTDEATKSFCFFFSPRSASNKTGKEVLSAARSGSYHQGGGSARCRIGADTMRFPQLRMGDPLSSDAARRTG
jgi:hypothetical protein